MPNLFIYTTPREATVLLMLDDGTVLSGVPCSANGRDDAHRIAVPPKTTGGAVLAVTCDGYLDRADRGLVIPPSTASGDVHFQLDDVRMTLVPPPPEPPPPPNPQQDPFALIQAIYQQGAYDLATKEGCGTYTDDCANTLHAQHSSMWGHIRKDPAQNQWEGHAVDAIMLLAKAGQTDAGIYDIILDTESPNAQPAWSYKGPPDPNLWMEP